MSGIESVFIFQKKSETDVKLGSNYTRKKVGYLVYCISRFEAKP